MKEALTYSLTLAAIVIIASGLLALTNLATTPKILAQEQNEAALSLKEVLPQAINFKPIENNGEIAYYQGLDSNNNLIGIAFISEGNGYSSTIKTMVGVNLNGKINAIKILSQNETPGLGARVQEIKDDTSLLNVLLGKIKKTAPAKPWFQAQFSGKTAQAIKVDTISGATITSQTVIKSIEQKTKKIMAEANIQFLPEDK